MSRCGSVDVRPEGEPAMMLPISAMVRVGASAVCADCYRHSSGRVRQSDPVSLQPRPSPSLGEDFLPGITSGFTIRTHTPSHLVSSTYRGDEGNNTPYFLIPTVLVAAVMFLFFHSIFFLPWPLQAQAHFARTSIFDTAYPRAGPDTRSLRLVQAQAATSFRPSHPRGQQFRGH